MDVGQVREVANKSGYVEMKSTDDAIIFKPSLGSGTEPSTRISVYLNTGTVALQVEAPYQGRVAHFRRLSVAELEEAFSNPASLFQKEETEGADLLEEAEALRRALKKINNERLQVVNLLKSVDPRGPRDNFRGEDRNNNNDGPRAKPRYRVRCRRCRQMGHVAADCSQPKTCYNCGDPGHVSSDCPRDGPICFSCKGQGHISSECPHPVVDDGSDM